MFPDGRIGSDPQLRRRPSTASASTTPPSRKWRAITEVGGEGRSGGGAGGARLQSPGASSLRRHRSRGMEWRAPARQCAYALAVQDVEAGPHDHGDAGHRQGVGHLAPYDIADGQRPQDRGVAERADHRELAAPSAAPRPRTGSRSASSSDEADHEADGARQLIGCQPSISAQPQPATATTSAVVKDTTRVGTAGGRIARDDVAEGADQASPAGPARSRR